MFVTRLLASAVIVLASASAYAGDPTGAPADFVADARLFHRVVACGPVDPFPPSIDAATVDKHCAEMTKRYESFRARYLTPAGAFFAKLRPAGLPTTVVYPFGGGDLASALVTYPDATEITTISLEHAGDPTRLATLTKAQLRTALTDYRAAVAGLLTLNDSTSENMRKLERGGIPGQLSFHITGAAAHGYEPVSLKYFTLEPDGSIHYLTKAEIDGLAAKKAKKKKGGWVDTDFSEAFTNMELTLVKSSDPTGRKVVHRHLAANLANKAFTGSPLEKHLQAKGKIVALTKAASYLIWTSSFSAIQDYLLANMAWMASDATGIAPKAAKKAGFTQTTYGTFAGAFLEEASPAVNEAMVKLWASQPRRKLPFRYGYPDAEKHVHLMITAPSEPKK
ncbi:MAG TPA: hypothetical protein VM513_23285 [Kofleriaceae bacterium]|nr:hypothetical protein [Kofleriaceae bacterium]